VYFEEKSHLAPAELERTRETERDLLHLFEGVYRDGVVTGEFRDVEPAIAVFGILGMSFSEYEWYRPDGPLPASAIADILGGLAADGYRVHA